MTRSPAATSPGWSSSAPATAPRLAWHLTYQATSVAYYDAVVDATTGDVLYRQNLTKFDGATTVFPNYPGAESDPNPTRPSERDESRRTSRPKAGSRGATTSPAPTCTRTPTSTTTTRERRRGDRAADGDARLPVRRPASRQPRRPEPGRRLRRSTPTADRARLARPARARPATARGTRPIPGSWQTNREQNGVAGLLPRQRLPRPPRRTRRSASTRPPATSRRRTTVDQSTPTTAPPRPATAARTTTTSTTRTCPRRRTAISPRMQMYLFATDPDASSRSATSTAATTRRPSGTSTRTASRTARHQRRRLGRRCRPRTPARWARRGATGTRSTCCTASGLEIDDPAPGRGRHRHLLRRRVHGDALRADRLPGRTTTSTAVPGRHRHRHRRLHVRRLRQRVRRPRGALRRRDLDADAVGPAHAR